MCPAYTFDNVKGSFPIGFLVWNLAQAQALQTITLDIFNENGASLGKKKFYTTLDKHKSLNQWWVNFKDSTHNSLGLISNYPSDFQNQQKTCVLSKALARYCLNITQKNLIPFAIYFSVRHCIPHTWINHNDQFLYPNNKWEQDSVFQSDCLVFMLFHGKNRITSKEGTNHFIPFSEKEIGACEAFESHFMRDFLQGKIKRDCETNKDSKQSLFGDDDMAFIPTKPLTFSQEAQEVLDAGKELFRHYHTQSKEDKDYNPNASLYDIKAYFQGFNDKGKMNPPQKADDEVYKQKLGTLNYALKTLAKNIESKVYEYGFLLP